MGISALILANLVTLTVVVLVWSAFPNMSTARAAARKIARRRTRELRRGKTGRLGGELGNPLQQFGTSRLADAA